jgi:hypothetical protein
LNTIDNAGTPELSIRDDINLDGVSVEKINESRIEIRTASEGEPVDPPNARDFYIEIPDPV